MDGPGGEAGVRAWPAMVGGLLAVLLVAGCGVVPDPERQASDVATDHVRSRALRFGTELWAGLRATDAAGAAEVVRRETELLAGLGGPGGGTAAGVLAAEVGNDGAVRLDLAFRDRAEAGGGLSYTPAPPRAVCLSGGDNDECVGG